MTGGAVYSPVGETDPALAGVTDHITLVTRALLTVVANCCVCDALSVDVPGAIVTANGGYSCTIAVDDLVLSATAVAVSVTCWGELITAGAV